MIMCRRTARRAERPRCILKLPGVLLGLLLLSGPGLADETPARPAPPSAGMPSVADVPEAARLSSHFSAEAATEAYLARIPPAAKVRSDAYFEGGCWLILWHYLYGAAVFLLLLRLGWSARIRDLAGKVTRFGPVHTFVYWAFFLVVVYVFASPLTVYEGFWREHRYGLATQSFGPWALDQLKLILVGIVLGGILAVLVFGIVRRLRKSWWIWGAAVTVLFLTFVAMIVPVFIDPIFNKVTRLDAPRVTGPILSMARANGIPARDVYQIDASRQTNRISAEVSGIGSTLRITLNDNLLRRGSLEEIEAAMGHEMGHYVLNHTYKGIAFFAVLIVGAFALLRWALARSIVRWGATWRVQDVGDTAVLPLVFFLVSTIFFVLTPVTNTFSRTLEVEADLFGLNAAGQPDGFAQAAILAGEYRKMSPGPLEEFVFYDHPSGRNRIFAAMRWKAENLSLVVTPSPAPAASPER